MPERAQSPTQPRFDGDDDQVKVPRLVVMLYHALAGAPLLLLGTLYLLASRGAQHLGYWPQPMVDDPKFIVHGDALYDFLYNLVLPLLQAAIFGIIVMPLGVWLDTHIPRWRHLLLIGLFISGWVLLFLDPTQRLFWYMD